MWKHILYRCLRCLNFRQKVWRKPIPIPWTNSTKVFYNVRYAVCIRICVHYREYYSNISASFEQILYIALLLNGELQWSDYPRSQTVIESWYGPTRCLLPSVRNRENGEYFVSLSRLHHFIAIKKKYIYIYFFFNKKIFGLICLHKVKILEKTEL